MNLDLYAKVKDQARHCRDLEVKKKLQLFLEVLKSGKVERSCRTFGYSSSSYYYFWWKRFVAAEFSLGALRAKSRRPIRSPRKISAVIIRKIRRYRFEFRYGPKRIALCLFENHQLKISESTIRRTIERKGWWIRKYRTKQQNPHRKRYELPYPSHLQVDIKYVPDRKVGERWYVYNAIDDCSRWRYAKAYRAINAEHAADFFGDLEKAAPFRILSVQTDNDAAFTNRLCAFWEGRLEHLFTMRLKESGVEHRLIPPGLKELNGKVERSHRIDDEEFYWKAQRSDFSYFQQELYRWIYAYNHHRSHGALGGQTPMERLVEKTLVPLYALALQYGVLEVLADTRRIKLTILETYLRYLDWLQQDPFHSLDVMNFYNAHCAHVEKNGARGFRGNSTRPRGG